MWRSLFHLCFRYDILESDTMRQELRIAGENTCRNPYLLKWTVYFPEWHATIQSESTFDSNC